MLLEIAGLARSTFNYVKKHMGEKERKDEAVLSEIKSIFNENNGKYGYPRITIELQELHPVLQRRKDCHEIKD